jgi:predicted GIY-YIG superfamily endonuclease
VHNLYTVYILRNAAGKVVYAGITAGKVATRALKHAGILKAAGMTGYSIATVGKRLTKAQARALEQKLIEKYGGPALARGGKWSSGQKGLLNKVWSYSGSNANYNKYNKCEVAHGCRARYSLRIFHELEAVW